MEKFKVHAGLFRYPLTLKGVSKTANSTAGNTEVYATTFNTRGYFRRLNSSNVFDAGINAYLITYEAYCYWKHQLESSITIDTRLVYDGREYKIENHGRVDEDRRFYRFELTTLDQ